MITTRDANHLSITVKGDRATALRAAASHGIPATFVRTTSQGESVLIVDMAEKRRVIQWYAHGGIGKQPAGTPLLFTETYVPPHQTIGAK